MRRRSISVVWVGVCLMLAGCKGEAEEANAPSKAVAAAASATRPGPGCGAADQPECARPAHLSDGTPVANEEYGIQAVFPAGSKVCEGLSGSHPHGFYSRLGDDRMECRPSRDPPNVTALSVWADYNTAFYKTPDEASGEACRTTGVGDRLTAPDGRPFRLKGLASRVCERAGADGAFSIEVTAMVGRWGGDDEDADAPYVIYTAGLTTTPDRLAADKVVFQRFLDGLVLTPPRPSGPGTPS